MRPRAPLHLPLAVARDRALLAIDATSPTAGRFRAVMSSPANVAEEEHDELRWATSEALSHFTLAHPEYLDFLRTLLHGCR